MSALVASDVAYTLQKKIVGESGFKQISLKVVFGDAAKTYPSGGVPLTMGKLGTPNQIISLKIYDPVNGDGYLYKYDFANNKLRIYQAPAQTHSHDVLLKNAAVADGATTRVNAGANLLGANTGSDITVTGGGANGGVVSKTLAAAALAEVSTAFVPASSVTLYVEVVGW